MKNFMGIMRHHQETKPTKTGIKVDEEKIGPESILKEILDDNFPNLRKEANIQVQEAQRLLTEYNPERSSPRHIIIKLSTKNSKSSKRKDIHYL